MRRITPLITSLLAVTLFGSWDDATAVRTRSAAAEEGSSGAAANSGREGTHGAISDAWRRHISAAKRKDLEAVMEIYADDALYIVPGGQNVRGRAAIKEMEAQALAEADVLQAEHTIESLKVFGDIAYELGTITGPIRQREKDPVTVTFHFMAMWQRQSDGVWRIRYFVGQPENAGL